MPAPAPVSANLPEVQRRQLNIVGDAAQILSQLENVKATAKPTSIAQLQSMLASIYSTTPTNIFNNIAEMIENGLSPQDLSTIINGFSTGENSIANVNPKDPSQAIYPKKDASDAPYSLPESQLRAAIQIPSTFTYGQKPPTILVPGTGSYGGVNFASNLRKLLTGVSYADPVWLNIPGAMLDDAQKNSEYVAYAINYISGISQNKKLSVISWSQGGLDTQWVLKYWPSTRTVVENFLPVSPDFHGTVLADLLCLSGASGKGLLPCAPSVIQQQYTSEYVLTLRKDDGDSAYVPTTTFYSAFLDEIVQPQSGTGASAFLKDARGVGVTNIEVQSICPGQPAGGLYTHESMLLNPLTYALIVDALTHDGPGNLDRIDKTTVCQQVFAPGITLEDAIATESLIVIAGVLLLTYPSKLHDEPALMSYAA